MIRSLGWLCLLAGIAGSGCVLFPERSQPAVPGSASTPSFQPVQPDEVTTSNAVEKAKALKQELDHDAAAKP
jgi:hypothetical protein